MSAAGPSLTEFAVPCLSRNSEPLGVLPLTLRQDQLTHDRLVLRVLRAATVLNSDTCFFARASKANVRRPSTPPEKQEK